MTTARSDNRLDRQQRPRRRPASARALEAAKTFHAPLTGRGENVNRQSWPRRIPEPSELYDDAPETT